MQYRTHVTWLFSKTDKTDVQMSIANENVTM